jgi:hypothetical protein
MRVVVLLMLTLGLLFTNLKVIAEEPLPSPEKIAEDFKATTNENQRYQAFNQLANKAELIAHQQNVKTYISVIQELITYSESLGDAGWVGSAGSLVIQGVSEVKVKLIMAAVGVIPLQAADQNDFLFYFKFVGESFQYNYLNRDVRQSVLYMTDLNYLSTAYFFLLRIEGENLIRPLEYLKENLRNLLYETAYLYCRQYPKLSEQQLEEWLPRLSTVLMIKLLSDIDSQILTVQQHEQKAVDQDIFIAKFLYKIIYAEFKNDPFNDWKYQAPLNTISAAVKKYEQMDWTLKLTDVQFLIDSLTPNYFISLCNGLGALIMKRDFISPSLAQQLMPAYDLLNDYIKLKKYLNDSDIFNTAYVMIKKAIVPRGEIEGEYRIENSKYSKLIVAFTNEKDMVAGLQSKDTYINVAFDRFDYEESDGYFISRSVQGPSLFVLKFKHTSNKNTQVCINEECYRATKVYNFQDYLAQLGKGNPNINVDGLYKGMIVTEDGNSEHGEVLISSVGGYLVGNFKFGSQINIAFDIGIHENTYGVLYLAAKVTNLPTYHIFRGLLKRDNHLCGEWFSTSKSQIGTFCLAKAM